MKIVQINTHDTRGGAALVAYGLHKGLLAAGHDSKMFVAKKLSSDPEVRETPFNNSIFKRLRRVYRDSTGHSGMLLYSDEASGGDLLSLDIIKDADIIHLHNSHGGYMNLNAVGELARVKPLVWTLHDMWAVTGHCAYSLECERWKTGCGQCPELDIYPSIKADNTKELWKVKSDSYRDVNMRIAVPSKWLYDIVKESMLGDQLRTLIPNAVDTEIFKPLDKQALRAKLGLPRERFILAFTAYYGSRNPYKGVELLKEALEIIKEAPGYDPYLVVIGEKDKMFLDKIGFEGKCVPYIDDPKGIAEYNNAADAFVLPSTAENSPLVVIESLACATPVVAFDVGGVPELVSHKETGYLASRGDSADLARGIGWIIDRSVEEREEMGLKAVENVKARHTMKKQFDAFFAIYEELTDLQ